MTNTPAQTGTLFIVATPIGNLDDFSPRAVSCLKQVNLIAAEDTRHSRKLLDAWGINTPMMALHEHNEQASSEKVIQRLQAGDDIALISDAGTPLISDPGGRLLPKAVAANINISPIPGACAATAALSASGLAAQPHWFEGFLPAKRNDRRKRLEALKNTPATLIFYEAPHRIVEFMNDAQMVLGEQRQACIAREISKKYEQFQYGSIASLVTALAALEQQRGEHVVIIEGAQADSNNNLNAISAEKALTTLLPHLPVKTAAKLAAELTGASKNELYQQALLLKETQ